MYITLNGKTEKIEHIKGRTCCLDIEGTCIGIYRIDETHLVMIDSGGAETPELVEWLKKEGYTVDAVIHTHIHIDHIGNSMLLEKAFGSRLIATQGEHILPRYKERGINFEIERIKAGDTVTVRDICFLTVSTPGHTQDHIMVITPDNVGFAGDAMITEGYLTKSLFPYMIMAGTAIESMEAIRHLGIDFCVCAHKGIVPADELDRLIDLNKNKHLRLFDILRETAHEAGNVSVEKLADLYMIKAGVFDAETRHYGYMIETAQARIKELIEAGELDIKYNKDSLQPR